MAFGKIGKKLSKGAKKVGQKASVGLGNVVAYQGKASVAVGKALVKVDGGENIGETLISTGRVEKHTGRGYKQLGRGNRQGAVNQSGKVMDAVKKIDLEKAVKAGEEAAIMFA